MRISEYIYIYIYIYISLNIFSCIHAWARLDTLCYALISSKLGFVETRISIGGPNWSPIKVKLRKGQLNQFGRHHSSRYFSWPINFQASRPILTPEF